MMLKDLQNIKYQKVKLPLFLIKHQTIRGGYSFMDSSFCHLIQVSGQLPEPGWTLWRQIFCLCWELNPSSSVSRSLISILTELCWYSGVGGNTFILSPHYYMVNVLFWNKFYSYKCSITSFPGYVMHFNISCTSTYLMFLHNHGVRSVNLEVGRTATRVREGHGNVHWCRWNSLSKLGQCLETNHSVLYKRNP
jgi:hypothetical protein